MSNEINIKPSKIVIIETEIKNGIKIERGYNKANVLIKESVFIDYNHDEKYENDELFSVEYKSGAMTSDSTKYIDENHDGYYDKVIYENSIFGKEIIDKTDLEKGDKKNFYGKDRRLIEPIYGSKLSDSPQVLN